MLAGRHQIGFVGFDLTAVAERQQPLLLRRIGQKEQHQGKHHPQRQPGQRAVGHPPGKLLNQKSGYRHQHQPTHPGSDQGHTHGPTAFGHKPLRHDLANRCRSNTGQSHTQKKVQTIKREQALDIAQQHQRNPVNQGAQQKDQACPDPVGQPAPDRKQGAGRQQIQREAARGLRPSPAELLGQRLEKGGENIGEAAVDNRHHKQNGDHKPAVEKRVGPALGWSCAWRLAHGIGHHSALSGPSTNSRPKGT